MASLFLLVSLSLAFLCNCHADLISNVCSKALNPSLCNQALTSDPRSRGTDLTGLGQIVIKKAEAATQDAIRVVKLFGKNKDIINVCVETCNNAINDLSQCTQLLKKFNKRSKGALQTKGSDALTNVGSCDHAEIEAGETVKVNEAIKRTQDLIDVLVVIAKSL